MTLRGGEMPMRYVGGLLTVGTGERPVGDAGGVLILGSGERPTGRSGGLVSRVPPSRLRAVSGASGRAAMAIPRRVRVDVGEGSRPGTRGEAMVTDGTANLAASTTTPPPCRKKYKRHIFPPLIASSLDVQPLKTSDHLTRANQPSIACAHH